MSTIYIKSKSLLLAGLALLVFTTIANAQYAGRDDDDDNNGESYFAEDGGSAFFDCTDFYNDTAGGRHITYFKRIVATDFSAVDSTFANKRTTGKRIWLFNSKGKRTMFTQYDSAGKCIDSMAYSFNKNNEMLNSITYKRNDSGFFVKMSCDVRKLDDSGHEIKDSSWERQSYGDTYNSTTEVTYSKYDNKGECTYTLVLRNGDTSTFETDTYDSKERMISERRKYDNVWDSVYRKYDDSSNVIEETNYSKNDTSNSRYTYDDKNREVTALEYNNGKLTRKENNVYKDDGSHVKYEEEHKQNEVIAGIGSCDIETISITKFDRNDNIVSLVTKRAQGNDTVTDSEINMYTYTTKGKTISDTDVHTVAEGIWNSSTDIKIYSNTYDAHENLLEELRLGDEENMEGGEKKLTYTYNDKDKLLQVSHYNSCDDAVAYSTDYYYYYPDGITLKQEKSGVYSGQLQVDYGKDSRVLSAVKIHPGFVIKSVFKYEE